MRPLFACLVFTLSFSISGCTKECPGAQTYTVEQLHCDEVARTCVTTKTVERSCPCIGDYCPSVSSGPGECSGGSLRIVKTVALECHRFSGRFDRDRRPSISSPACGHLAGPSLYGVDVAVRSWQNDGPARLPACR